MRAWHLCDICSTVISCSEHNVHINENKTTAHTAHSTIGPFYWDNNCIQIFNPKQTSTHRHFTHQIHTLHLHFNMSHIRTLPTASLFTYSKWPICWSFSKYKMPDCTLCFEISIWHQTSQYSVFSSYTANSAQGCYPSIRLPMYKNQLTVEPMYVESY